MKKYYFFTALIMASMALSYCSSSKKAAAKEVAKTTYAGNLSTVIAGSCSPCHIPSKGGNKKAYDNYANVKSDIDEIIRRIELNPADRGFMPFRKAEKLPADVINAFKQWKTDGMLEN